MNDITIYSKSQLSKGFVMTDTKRHMGFSVVRQCIFLVHVGHIRAYLYGMQREAADPIGNTENCYWQRKLRAVSLNITGRMKQIDQVD